MGYGNEVDLGLALRELLPKHGFTRADVFILSKLDHGDHGARALDACLRSLHRLACVGPTIDLFLIHWPGTEGLDPADPRNAGNRAQSWSVLEDLYASGKFRAIGVSNYTPSHLAELLRTCRTPPAVLQVELHPMLSQRELRRVCAKSGVYFQAFSSLGKGALVQEPEVVAVTEACGRTAAQVMLRWALQQGVGVLSRDATRVRENGCVFDFELSLQHMQRLSVMDCGRRVCRRDPSCVI